MATLAQAITRGVIAARPATGAGKGGQTYYATDENKVYHDDGSGWLLVASNVTALADVPGLVSALAGKQPLDSDLTAIAALAPADDGIMQRKAGAWVGRTPAQVKTDLALVKADVGLGSVDNTSDAGKPVSTAQAAADTAAQNAAVAAAKGLPLGLTGAVSPTRYVGATASVAPTTGTFAQGDFVVTLDGKIYICTAPGTPGTWVQIAGSGSTDTEAVQDIIGAMIAAAGGSYNDAANTITLPSGSAAALLGPDGDLPSFYLPSGQERGTVAEAGRWVRNGTILSPVQTFEATAVQEPFVIVEGGLIKLWYTGGWSAAAMGYATCPVGSDPTVSGNWTKHTGAIFGGGASGRAGQVLHHGIAHVGSTYYAYYADGTVGSDLRYATSTDGIAWTDGGVALAHNAVSWSTEWANPHAWVDDAGVWQMIVEGRAPTTMAWILARATSTDGLTWTVVGTGPLTTLRIHVDGAYSGGWLCTPRQRDGLYHLWYHACAIAASLPSDIYHATSPDLDTWTLVGSGPVLTHTGSAPEVDQAADPAVVEIRGTTYLFYDALDNPSSASVIRVASIAATLAQVVDGSAHPDAPLASSPAGSYTAANITVDARGRVTTAASGGGGSAYGGPAFAAHKNGTDQTIPTGTFTKITFGTESFDTAGAYDAATSRFQPLVAGCYQINAVVRWNSPTSNERLVSVYKNGSEYKRIGDDVGGSFTTVQTQAGGVVVQLNGSTDYVEIFAFQQHGSNRDISGIDVSTHFSGARVN